MACAVRFTRFHRDYDRKPDGVFISGDEHTYAEYDWYLQGDGSADFSKPNVTSGHGSVRNTPSIGIGHYSFKPLATLYVPCGSLKVEWAYPNALAFVTYVTSYPRFDYDLELAPTKAAEIHGVDLKSPRLHWYKLQDRRAPFFVPLDQLQ